MLTSASPSSRPSSPNEPAQLSPLPKALPLSAAGLFLYPTYLGCGEIGVDRPKCPAFPVPGGSVSSTRHEIGPSTTFNPVPPNTTTFHEKPQDFYLRFCFFALWHGRGWAVKRSRWASFVASGSCGSPLRLLPFGFLPGGYTFNRNTGRTEEVSKCRITGQYKKEMRTRWLMGVLSR